MKNKATWVFFIILLLFTLVCAWNYLTGRGLSEDDLQLISVINLFACCLVLAKAAWVPKNIEKDIEEMKA